MLRRLVEFREVTGVAWNGERRQLSITAAMESGKWIVELLQA
jgi:hypothetical protein